MWDPLAFWLFLFVIFSFFKSCKNEVILPITNSSQSAIILLGLYEMVKFITPRNIYQSSLKNSLTTFRYETKIWFAWNIKDNTQENISKKGLIGEKMWTL